jgi:DNA mismatch endonuclease, patch repair protein
MADVFTKRKRSQVMASIRSVGNKETEQSLVAIFRRHQVTGWRRHVPILGRPDFTFWKQRVTVFVDGCFWHGCTHHSRLPKSNRAYWQRKLARNITRDAKITRELKRRGWSVVRFWHHDLKREESVVARVQKALTGKNGFARNLRGPENRTAK